MSKSILVIDDEGVRKGFHITLKDTEYQVVTVESGETALERLKKSKFDFIFLDLMMPVIDGI